MHNLPTELLLTILAGCALLVAGQQSRRRFLRLHHHGLRTQGTVVSFRKTGDDRYATICFLTEDNRQIIQEVIDYGYSKESSLSIWYDPLLPTHFVIGSPSKMGFYSITLIGTILIVYAIWRLIS
ncbi:DUF3592 domain-containing protein [Hymenobacter glacieicola]|nr:DUF3592 domain-containing protein [Hymenobacter glacieicola]